MVGEKSGEAKTMFQAHTILIETGGEVVRFVPPEPMDLLSIYQRFADQRSGHTRPIVTSEGKGTARVAMVPDLDSVIEEINELIS